MKLLLKADDLINFKSQAKEVLSLTNAALNLQDTDYGYFLRARSHMNLGNLEEALQDFEKAILISLSIVFG